MISSGFRSIDELPGPERNTDHHGLNPVHQSARIHQGQLNLQNLLQLFGRGGILTKQRIFSRRSSILVRSDGGWSKQVELLGDAKLLGAIRTVHYPLD